MCPADYPLSTADFLHVTLENILNVSSGLSAEHSGFFELYEKIFLKCPADYPLRTADFLDVILENILNVSSGLSAEHSGFFALYEKIFSKCLAAYKLRTANFSHVILGNIPKKSSGFFERHSSKYLPGILKIFPKCRADYLLDKKFENDEMPTKQLKNQIYGR
jgi:hypothetical protein